MNGIMARAKRIVEQYGRDGTLSEDSLASAEFGVWDRQTPGLLLIGASCYAAMEHPELAERAAAEPGREVLATILKGDLHQALALVDGGAAFGWGDLVAWLWACVRRPGAGPGALDALLEQAAELGSEALEEVTRPRVRDGQAGPWDQSETPQSAGIERIDFGVLKIPRLDGAQPRLMRVGDQAQGVIVALGRHSLGLQVFMTPHGPVWDAVRPRIVEGILQQGGYAQDSVGVFGMAIRAEIPVIRDGQQMLQPTCIIGCDGPGWLLRGMFSGPQALTETTDLRLHHFFTQTVVDLRAGAAHETEEMIAAEVRWPAPE